MSGIAGIIKYDQQLNNQKEILDCMQKVLKSRGPDQSGQYLVTHAALLQTRLALIDIENSQQPLTTNYKKNNLTIVYDGELYNSSNLRNRMCNEGMEFVTKSDTEVVLKAYIKWGEHCLQEFIGIFAFAIWDEQKEQLFLARDRMGAKPLFYAQPNGTLIFGSKINVLLQHPDISPCIDQNGIAEIMLLGPGHTPGCGIYHGIAELEPGQCANYSRKGLQIRTYWKLIDRENIDSIDQTLEKIRWLVYDATEHQTISDIPIAAFLSGGLSSSVISAISARRMAEQQQRLSTFSLNYSNTSSEQTDTYIQSITKHIGCTHNTITLSAQEVANSLYDAVIARDLPGMADIDSSLLLFCNRIKQSSSVVLSGDCADIVFSGFPWHRDDKIHHSGFPWSQFTTYRTSFLKDKLADTINAQEFVNERYRKSIEAVSIADDPSPIERRMKEMMYLNIQWYMQALLERLDRMSMYSGLQIRVPFCDHRLVETLYTTPWDYKDYDGREMGLLRKAAQDLLPQEILWRKRQPYPQISDPAYLALIKDRLYDIISNPNSALLTFIKKSALEKLLKNTCSEPWYGQLMMTPQAIAYFLQIQYWLEEYHIYIS